ncbi:MAG: enoyl-CoA hydratase/isomerase family protein [Acidimicrobiia bacterium]
MATDYRIDEADGVLTFTLTREAKANAVSWEMFAAMRDAAEELDERKYLRVLVYAAEGKFFTSGLDLSSPALQAADGDFRRFYRGFHAWLDYLEMIEKPVIMAVQGRCLGLGIELGASCDFRLASDAATFELPEIANLALIPGSGGISRLTRIVGPHWTKYLVMAGKRISAEKAEQIGYVHEVCAASSFVDLVHDFAVALTKVPAEALGIAKLGIDHAVTADRRASRDFDRMAQSYLIKLDDFAEKMSGFAGR